MKKQTKQLVFFALAILLVIGWAMWPRSLERLILKHHAAADFSTVERFQVLWTPPNAVRDYDAGAYPSWTLEEELTQPILDILRKATISRPSRRNWQAVGDEGDDVAVFGVAEEGSDAVLVPFAGQIDDAAHDAGGTKQVFEDVLDFGYGVGQLGLFDMIVGQDVFDGVLRLLAVILHGGG